MEKAKKERLWNSPALRRRVSNRVWQNRYIYMMVIPVVIYLLLLRYMPLWFLRSSFYDYKLLRGFDSKFVGFANFERLFTNPSLMSYIGNTLKLNLSALIFLFPAPMIFAILLNELRGSGFKKGVQTISYLPHFVSTVVLVSMIRTLISPSIGTLAAISKAMGSQPIDYLSRPEYFVIVNVISGFWQSVGWEAVIYVAALAGIDQGLYEAARIDGANRWKRFIYVTLPLMRKTMALSLILSVTGSILAFDQFYIMTAGGPQNKMISVVYYIFNQSFVSFNLGYGAAMSLVLLFILVLISIFQLWLLRVGEDRP